MVIWNIDPDESPCSELLKGSAGSKSPGEQVAA